MWRAPVVVTAPAAEPLSLADAKAHLDELSDDRDGLIEDYIETARSHVEGMTGTRLITQTVDLKASDWADFGALPLAPVQTVSSVTYIDAAGDEQTLSTDVYEARLEGLEPGLFLKFGQVWPAAQQGSTITVRAVAGYGDAADVPAAIVHSLKLLVRDFYENREPVPSGLVNTTVDALLCNFRKHLI